MFVISRKKSRTVGGKEIHRLALGYKNLWKIYRLAN
jgi:hypothetical protein